MNILHSIILILAIIHLSYGVPLRLQKRAAFYIANETACVVDNIVYSNGDPIPTDDPCESCKCRPPGFACVLMDCEVKHGCRAVRRAGHCCPEYVCDTEKIPIGEGDPFNRDEESNFETTMIPNLITASKVEYVEDTSETHDTEDTPVVEIFDKETNIPDLLQLDPSAVEIPTVAVNETINSAENDKDQNISPHAIEIIEHHFGEQGSTEIKNSAELPTKENNADTEDKYEEINDEKHEDSTEQFTESTSKSPLTATSANLHYFTDEIKSLSKSSTETFSQPEEYSTKTPLQVEDSLTEKPLKLEDIYNPVVSENTEIEAEEPSNALESGNPASDYGKSLRLTDQDDTKSGKTENPEETTLIENSSIASTEALPFEDKSNQDINNQSTDSEVLIKDLYYNADEKAVSDLVETVTTIVHLKEESQPSTKDEIISVDSSSSTEKENLLQYVDSKLVSEENISTSEDSLSTQLSDKKIAAEEIASKEDSTTLTNEGTQSTIVHSENNQDVDKFASVITESEQDSTTKNAE